MATLQQVRARAAEVGASAAWNGPFFSVELPVGKISNVGPGLHGWEWSRTTWGRSDIYSAALEWLSDIGDCEDPECDTCN